MIERRPFDRLGGGDHGWPNTRHPFPFPDSRAPPPRAWVPLRGGNERGWGGRAFRKGGRSGHFVTLASGFDEGGDALPIRADARVLGATLKAGEIAEYRLADGRRGYLVSARGAVEVNGVRLDERDGAAIENERVVTVTALDDAEIVMVDVS